MASVHSRRFQTSAEVLHRAWASDRLSLSIDPDGTLVIRVPVKVFAEMLPIVVPNRSGEVKLEGTLTPRQKQILDGILRGLQNKEIAAELGIGVRTVKHHARLLLERYGVFDRHELKKAATGTAL